MKKEEISAAVDKLDDRYIEEYFETKDALLAAKRRKALRKRGWAVAIAAVLAAILLTSAMLLPAMLREEESTESENMGEHESESSSESMTEHETKPTPPTYDSAYLSASEMAQSIAVPGAAEGATTAYQKIYLPFDRQIWTDPLPKEEYASIYTLSGYVKPIDPYEFTDFYNAILPQILDATGMSLDELKPWESTHDNRLYKSYRTDDFSISFSQDAYPEGICQSMAEFESGYFSEGKQKPLVINGKTVQIDIAKSDLEILRSLESIRDDLFVIFGRSFDSARVSFYCYENGFVHVIVDYYNRADDPFFGDRIRISFHENRDLTDESQRTTVIDATRVLYFENRGTPEEYYNTEALCRLITLEEAEALLRRGYVFSGHSCALCAEMIESSQEPVLFDSYDYVSYEYRFGRERGIPFYVFYKKIGVSESGNTVYAKTYICAIELSGYEEYYESQKVYHSKIELE